MKNRFSEVVLTGGPSAGKTTGFDRLVPGLKNVGLRVFAVPEVATLFMKKRNIDLRALAQSDFKRFLKYEREMLRLQMKLRRKYRARARLTHGRSVILYDRGPMDFVPYVPASHLKSMFDELNLTLHDVRDSFKAVIHLVTAADGAEKYFSNANNPTRTETPEEARELDRKTLNAWVGHPELKIIDNSTGFNLKMNRLLKTVIHVLGIPEPLEIERKFLVAQLPDLSAIEGIQPAKIEQIYLTKEGDERVRIRKRIAKDGSATYYRTVKTATEKAVVRYEQEHFISAAKYSELAKRQKPDTRVIKKTRYCFVYKHQYFELDVFKNPPGLVFLEIELTEAKTQIELPPFINIARDVTDDPSYSNRALAHIA